MRPLAIISEMCDIIKSLSNIVKKQIERSKVEEQVKKELRGMVSEAERKMDVNEYHLRHIIDTDDGEPLEEGAADDH